MTTKENDLYAEVKTEAQELADDLEDDLDLDLDDEANTALEDITKVNGSLPKTDGE